MGDININIMNCDKHTLSLHKLKREFNFYQLMYGPTCSGVRLNVHYESCIDHVYVNVKQNYQKFDHIPFAGSDHHLTFATRKVNKEHPPGRTIKYRPYATADLDSLKSDLNNFDFTYLKNNQIQSNSNDFNSDILQLLQVHIPIKQRRIRPSPPSWFTSGIAKMCRYRNSLKRIASRTKLPADWQMYKKIPEHCYI